MVQGSSVIKRINLIEEFNFNFNLFFLKSFVSISVLN